MTRFAGERHIDAFAKFAEEALRHRRFELQLWWQLHEQHPELSAQTMDFRGKSIQYVGQRREFAIVRQRSRHFHCETEVRRNARGPTLISLRAMMPMERAVDLHGVQSPCISLQV